MNILEKALAIIADKTLVHDRVDDDEKKRRLDICEKPCRYFDHESRRCKVCTCFLDSKTSAKTNFNLAAGRNEITHCPKGFWDDIDIANFYRLKDGKQPIN